ncbi:hypothetical protein ACOI1A_12055 [Corynebacterium glutamicum]|uniref:hypothetical protein n=1 Tax=Corynebacterium glutamicum TaxID=1718 RepID=UPI003B5D00B4
MGNISAEPPLPMKCNRHIPGHDPFYLQVFVLLKNTTWEPVTNLRMDGQFVEFDAGGEHIRGWNHDPARMEWFVKNGGPAEWSGSSPTSRLMRFESKNGHYMVSIGPKYDRNGCYGNISLGIVPTSPGLDFHEGFKQALEAFKYVEREYGTEQD